MKNEEAPLKQILRWVGEHNYSFAFQVAMEEAFPEWLSTREPKSLDTSYKIRMAKFALKMYEKCRAECPWWGEEERSIGVYGRDIKDLRLALKMYEKSGDFPNYVFAKTEVPLTERNINQVFGLMLPVSDTKKRTSSLADFVHTEMNK